MTSRRNLPISRADSAVVAPGLGTSTAYLRKSGIFRSRIKRPPLVCGLSLIRRWPFGASSANSGLSRPWSSNSSSGR